MWSSPLILFSLSANIQKISIKKKSPSIYFDEDAKYFERKDL